MSGLSGYRLLSHACRASTGTAAAFTVRGACNFAPFVSAKFTSRANSVRTYSLFGNLFGASKTQEADSMGASTSKSTAARPGWTPNSGMVSTYSTAAVTANVVLAQSGHSPLCMRSVNQPAVSWHTAELVCTCTQVLILDSQQLQISS